MGSCNRILRAEDQSDRVCSSIGRKIRTHHQLYWFVSSALFSSENERSESEERFKRPVQALPSNPGGGQGGTAIVIWAILVCAAVKGIVFKQFTLG